MNNTGSVPGSLDKPRKTGLQVVKDNWPVVLGMGAMFALIIKGIWHAGKGEQLKSNRLAQIRSALGITIVLGFGVSAYLRDKRREAELERRRQASARPRSE